MSWATAYIARLQEGVTVQFRPRGHSMTGKIDNGQLVTVVPIKEDTSIAVGDAVLCKVNGKQYLHLVKAVRGAQYLIGNNRGLTNGWTSHVFGKVTKVEP